MIGFNKTKLKTMLTSKDLTEPCLENGIIPLRELVRISCGEPKKWLSLTSTEGAQFCTFRDADGETMKLGYINEHQAFVLASTKGVCWPVLNQVTMFEKIAEWGINLKK